MRTEDNYFIDDNYFVTKTNSPKTPIGVVDFQGRVLSLQISQAEQLRAELAQAIRELK